MINRVVNLFPRDTRILEITSGLGLVFNSFLIFHYRESIGGLILSDRPEFWVIAFAILGIFQLSSVIFDPELFVLRIITTWFAGYYWLWAASNNCAFLEQSCSGTIHIDCVLKLIMGIGLSYAFIVQFSFARLKWKILS